MTSHNGREQWTIVALVVGLVLMLAINASLWLAVHAELGEHRRYIVARDRLWAEAQSLPLPDLIGDEP